MALNTAFTAALNLQFTVSHPREIFWVLGLMKMDMLNFTIQTLRKTTLSSMNRRNSSNSWISCLVSQWGRERRTATPTGAIKALKRNPSIPKLMLSSCAQ